MVIDGLWIIGKIGYMGKSMGRRIKFQEDWGFIGPGLFPG